MRLLLVGLLALLLPTACTSSPTPTSDALLQNGLEKSPGWNGVSAALFSTNKAHQGQVSMLVGTEVAVGATFARTPGELGMGGEAYHPMLRSWVRRTAAGSTAWLVAPLDASATDQTKGIVPHGVLLVYRHNFIPLCNFLPC